MKKLFMSSLALIAFSFSVLLFQISCKKDVTAQTPVTSLTKQQILVQKTWKLDQLHSVINGVYASYMNGGTNTTGVDYDKLRYTFKDDGTGTYVDQFNSSRAFTWQFTSVDQRAMKLTITGASAPDVWQMVEIAGNYLHATENFATSNGNSNNLHSFRIVQIP